MRGCTDSAWVSSCKARPVSQPTAGLRSAVELTYMYGVEVRHPTNLKTVEQSLRCPGLPVATAAYEQRNARHRAAGRTRSLKWLRDY